MYINCFTHVLSPSFLEIGLFEQVQLDFPIYFSIYILKPLTPCGCSEALKIILSLDFLNIILDNVVASGHVYFKLIKTHSTF